MCYSDFTGVDVFVVSSAKIASGGVDARVVLFNADTHKVAGTLKGHTKPVGCVAFHSSEQALYSGSEDCTVRVWAPSSSRSMLPVITINSFVPSRHLPIPSHSTSTSPSLFS